MKLKEISRRDFLKMIWSATGLTVLATFGGWKYATQTEPGNLELVELPLTLPRLDPAFNGFKIAVIGDIHLGGWMNRERLIPAIDMILAQPVDLILIPGDLMAGYGWNAGHERDLDDLSAELSRLSAYKPTFAVLGNHDYWTKASAVRKALAKINITELPNSYHTLKRGSAELHICGIDDFVEKKDDLNALLLHLPPEGAAILMVHEPDFADLSAATERFDLQISGHTHGGQVVIPNYGPLFLPQLGKKYPSGLYKVGEMWQYTNRGVGMGGISVRFNCRPEITIFTLLT